MRYEQKEASGVTLPFPTAVCSCGSQWFGIQASFDPDTYEVQAYLTDGVCVNCGASVIVPTPADKEL